MLEYDYDFLRVLNGYVKIYEAFSLPAVICDGAFKVYWSNPAAKSAYPQFTDTVGMQKLFGEFNPANLFEQIKRDGTLGIEGALPFLDLKLNLMPMTHKDETIGVIVVFVGGQTTRRSAVAGSKMPQAFETGVRRSVEDIFRIMDAAALKADIMQSGWVKSSFRDIAKSSYFILRIASNISHYSAFQTGNEMLSLKTVEIFDLLREYKDAVTGLASEMGIPVRFDLPGEGGIAGADTEKLGLAFFNILHNAMYFTRQGNEIDITGEADDAKVTVTVRDKGIGIPQDILPHICKPYYAYGHSGAGIGLGLTIAKYVIESHGGSLMIDSAQNKGTSVTFTIPKGAFSRRVTLAQNKERYAAANRFSNVYVGLVDASISPYRDPEHEEE